VKGKESNSSIIFAGMCKVEGTLREPQGLVQRRVREGKPNVRINKEQRVVASELEGQLFALRSRQEYQRAFFRGVVGTWAPDEFGEATSRKVSFQRKAKLA
jgi:hypothetical protein